MRLSDSRSPSGCRVCERPTGEGERQLLESGPREPEGEDPIEIPVARLIFRHVIAQAVHDMGYGRVGERAEVRNFTKTDWFVTICTYADWDEDWVRKIFVSVDKLHDDVRRDITRQVVKMLKTVSGLGLS